MSSLVKRLDCTSIEMLLRAIIRVFSRWEESKEERSKLGKPGPNSDQYYMSTRKYRPEMLDAVLHEWCSIGRVDAHMFPFHEDFVCYSWMMYRKETDEAKSELKRQLFNELF